MPKHTEPAKRDRVAIIGWGGTRHEVPWMEKGWEFWGVNYPGDYRDTAESSRHPFTRWYQLHRRQYLETHVDSVSFLIAQPWYRGLRHLPLVVWEPKDWPDCPTAMRYPFDTVTALKRGTYHASSIDWMIASAIVEGFKRIDVYGVNFGPTEGGEPIAARSCMEYWLGVAEGKGIETNVHGGAAFHTYYHTRSTRMYGYHDLLNEVEEPAQ